VTLPAPSGDAAGSASAPVASSISMPDANAREIAHGVVVDLHARREVRTLLADDDVWNDADDGKIAYEHIRADQVKRMKEELRAYDLATGAQIWSHDASRCYAMIATGKGVLCDSDKNDEVVLHDAKSGAPTSIAAPGLVYVTSFERMGSKVAAISSSYSVAVFFDAATVAPAGKLDLPRGFRLARVKNGVACGAGFDPTTATFACFDATPRILWSKKLPLADGELHMADDHDILVGTRVFTSNVARESYVVSIDDGHVVAHVPVSVSSLVRRPNGVLAGFFRAARPSAMVGLDGKDRWTTNAFVFGDSSRTVVSNDTLVVAAYGHITAGAEIAGFDLATGAQRWKGDLELLPISHSAYSNDVELRPFEDIVVMRGREAMQDYLALFDPASGRRLYETLRRR
jgi:outer membrane protein assembly factor BamB